MGFLGEGPGNVSSLLLATGKLVDLAVGDIPQFHGGYGFVSLFTIDLSEASEMSEVWKASHCDDVANADGEVALVLVDLGKVGNFASGIRDGFLPPIHGAGLSFQEAGEEADQRALSCSVGSEKSQSLSAVHGEGDFCERFLGAVAIGNVGKVELMVNVAHFVRSH